MPSVIDDFRARAADAQAEVHLLRGWPEVASLAFDLAHGEPIAMTTALARTQPELTDLLGARAVLPESDAPATSVADSAVGIVRGALAVAETGSVLLIEPDLVDRCVSLLSHALIVVVDRARVVESLDAVADTLAEAGPPAFASIVTGPSRTADIERSLTIGVQGPREVHVVVLG